MKINTKKQCEYIGCNKESKHKVKYKITCDKEIECHVCSDHKNDITQDIVLKAKSD